MTEVEARYLDGLLVTMNKVESVGSIMVHFAKMHHQFASDIVVVCVDTGKNLSDAPSETPPPKVQVVVNPETKRTTQDLLLTLRLHSMCEDVTTSALAYTLLRKRYCEKEMIDNLLEDLLDHVLKAAACGDSEIETRILRTLIRAGVNANYFLLEAAGNGDEYRVKMLLAEGVPVECPTNSDNEIACSIPPLATAAFWGHVSIVEILLAHKANVNRLTHVHEEPSIPICYNDSDLNGAALVMASHNGHADVVKILIKHKARVNDVRINDWPLNAACSEERIAAVEVLLSHRADPNYAIPSLAILGKHDYPIMWAAKLGNVDLAKVLISYRANVQFFDNVQDTPLIEAVRINSRLRSSSRINFDGKLEVVKLLITHSAGVNIGNRENGITPLVAALLNEVMGDAVKILLDHKADVNIGNCYGDYPLLVAAQNGDADIVNLLLAHKANLFVDNILKTAIAESSKKNHKDVLEILEPLYAIVEASRVIPRAVLKIPDSSCTIPDVFDNWKTYCLTNKISSPEKYLNDKTRLVLLLSWTSKEAKEFNSLSKRLSECAEGLLRQHTLYNEALKRIAGITTHNSRKENKNKCEKDLFDVTRAREDFLRERILSNTLKDRKSQDPPCDQCLTDEERLELVTWTMKEGFELENMGLKLDRCQRALLFARNLYKASANDEKKKRRDEAEKDLLDAIAERKEFLSKRIQLNAPENPQSVSAVSVVADEIKRKSEGCSETPESKRVKTNNDTTGKESYVP